MHERYTRPGRPAGMQAKCYLGECLTRLARFEEAETLLKEALHALRTLQRGQHHAHRARATLVAHYEQRGMLEEASRVP